MAKLKVTRSTGNVFEDLGFDRETAENLRIRSALMIEVEQFVRRRNLTQAQAAKLFWRVTAARERPHARQDRAVHH